jgi:hypothetical protein
MRVRYLQGMGEPRGPGIKAGEVRDVSADEGERLVRKGIAEPTSAKAGGAEKGKSKASRGGKKTSAKAGGAEKAD